jgi:phenylpropionate dioxygenase-like ring-hydroxylating dioxygenase large terminal subunit
MPGEAPMLAAARWRTAQDSMRELLDARTRHYSLAQPFYADAGLFELDLQAIFYRRWLFAGAACEVAQPGQYFTVQVGPSSVIVVRDRSNAIRAFHNTCRHRGSRICNTEKGRVGAFVCPYHQWTYDLTGTLRHAGRMHEGFSPDGIGLRPVHVETVAGTIYICLADEPPDFAPYKAALEPMLAPHDLANAKLAHEAHIVERGNWKLVMENSRECYHCRTSHPELMRTFLDTYNFQDPATDPIVSAFVERCNTAGLPSNMRSGDDFRVSRMPLTRDAASITMDGKEAVTKPLGGIVEPNIGSLRWVHFPSVFNHALRDYAILVRMLPVGPQETLVTAKWLVHREAEAGRDYDLTNLVETWTKTNDQDRILVERNQQGINSLGYMPGPYSELSEAGVITFVEWYCRTMQRYLDGA